MFALESFTSLVIVLRWLCYTVQVSLQDIPQITAFYLQMHVCVSDTVMPTRGG